MEKEAAVAAALELLANVRAADPLVPVGDAVATLVATLENISEGSSPHAGALAPKVALALLHVPNVVPSMWEACVCPVILRVSRCGELPWTARCLVAKKLPSTLDGQNCWGTADVIKERTQIITEGLFAQAELQPGGSTQELRVIADALSVVLTKTPFAVGCIAKRLVAQANTFKSLLPLLVGKLPTSSSFYCAVESALCSLKDNHEDGGDTALPSSGAARRTIEEDLKLLPAVYEGKGSAALRSLVIAVVSDVEKGLPSKIEIEANDDDSLAEFSTRIENLLNQGNSNPTAFRHALSSADIVRSILNCWAPCLQNLLRSSSAVGCEASSHQGNHNDNEVGAAAVAPHMLTLLRGLSMLVVCSGISAEDGALLLGDETVQAALLGPLRPIKESGEEGSNVVLLSTFTEDQDMCALECQLLVAKKLLVATKPTTVSNSEGKDALPAATALLHEAFSQYSRGMLGPLEETLAEIIIAEKLLRPHPKNRQHHNNNNNNSGNQSRKRGRDVHTTGDITAVDGGQSPSSSSDSIITVSELKSYEGVLRCVLHLAKFHALGVDHKVSPSWA